MTYSRKETEQKELKTGVQLALVRRNRRMLRWTVILSILGVAALVIVPHYLPSGTLYALLLALTLFFIVMACACAFTLTRENKKLREMAEDLKKNR